MSSLQYRLISSANADLAVIWESIARDNLEAADRTIAAIHEPVRLLAKYPHIGHSRPDQVAHRPVLFSSVGRYLILYEVRRDWLVVIAALHSARDTPTILRHRKAEP